MSGEVRYLQGGADVEALVRAAGLVVENAGVRTAVIGGLAVTCRLAAAHRATGDVDFVADEPEVVTQHAAVSNLVAAGVGTRDSGTEVVRLDVGGTKVEIIETSALNPADVAEVEPERARLFVLAHRWALESATLLRIGVTGSDLEVEVPVATASALVATKLHAIQDRNDDRKKASDAWDLFRLIDLNAGSHDFAGDIGTAPEGLAALMHAGVLRIFRAEVTRTRRWMQVYGEPEWAAVATENALIGISEAFADIR